MADRMPTISEIQKLRVADLKLKLTSFSQPTNGLKAELVSRLHSYYLSNSSSNNTVDEDSASSPLKPSTPIIESDTNDVQTSIGDASERLKPSSQQSNDPSLQAPEIVSTSQTKSVPSSVPSTVKDAGNDAVRFSENNVGPTPIDDVTSLSDSQPPDQILHEEPLREDGRKDTPMEDQNISSGSSPNHSKTVHEDLPDIDIPITTAPPRDQSIMQSASKDNTLFNCPPPQSDQFSLVGPPQDHVMSHTAPPPQDQNSPAECPPVHNSSMIHSGPPPQDHVMSMLGPPPRDHVMMHGGPPPQDHVMRLDGPPPKEHVMSYSGPPPLRGDAPNEPVMVQNMAQLVPIRPVDTLDRHPMMPTPGVIEKSLSVPHSTPPPVVPDPVPLSHIQSLSSAQHAMMPQPSIIDPGLGSNKTNLLQDAIAQKQEADLLEKARQQISMINDQKESKAVPLMSLNVEPSKDLLDKIEEVKPLPHALERVLGMKDERERAVGVTLEEAIGETDVAVEENHKNEDADDELEKPNEEDEEADDVDYYNKSDDDEEEVSISGIGDRIKKTQLRLQKKKEKKKKRRERKQNNRMANKTGDTGKKKTTEDRVQVEYVPELIDKSDPAYFHFVKVFDMFKIIDSSEAMNIASVEAVLEPLKLEDEKAPNVSLRLRKAPMLIEDDDEDEMKNKPLLSRKKQRKMNRLSVAELKQLVTRPDVVEMHDVTAKDPKLLVHLKGVRNSVPVPRHWCFKRKYLQVTLGRMNVDRVSAPQGKRGLEKSPFDLPEFIKNTGIMEMRQALQEKEDQQTLKSKMRNKVRPKMGKIDIDYQKLHDAFFKYQTKPKMTVHGDLYYEGKEFETRLKEKKPGELTEELRIALGMTTGGNKHKFPPPWLIAMQRYGPPPSYPNQKIAGLNCAIPESCTFGYHAGGWGKPPVDENGRPLYGDVFGVHMGDTDALKIDDEVDKTMWGGLESESEESEEEDDDDDDEVDNVSGIMTPADGLLTPGLITPSGVSSTPLIGFETPDTIELRKKRVEEAMDQSDTPQLYQVIPEKRALNIGASMMSSGHTYDLPTKPGGIDISLDPDEIDLDSAAMQAMLEQTMKEKEDASAPNDLSDMVAEHTAKQQQKRKKQQQQQHQDQGRQNKRQKQFKF